MRLLLNIGFALLLLFLYPACRKGDGERIKADRVDFTGTWKGELVSYASGRKIVQKYAWEIYTDPADGRLSGLLTMSETNKLEELQFSDGIWYFRVINSDSLNPQCREWSFSGYAKFQDDGIIEFNLAGNKCGPIGDQFETWGGTLTRVSDTLVPGGHFGFIKAGNSWNYTVIKNNTDTCTLNYLIASTPGTDAFEGTMTSECSWNWQEKHFSWMIDPCRFTVLPDNNEKIALTVFTLDMLPGSIYHFESGTDVSVTSLLQRNEMVIVPAGNFLCNKYLVETAPDFDSPSTGTVSYYWISNRYGIIKREVLNPADSTSLKLQVLTSKNF